MLKKGGALLVTVPGISQISEADYKSWGHYWAFTDMSLRRLFEQFTSENNIQIRVFGNVKTSSLFLYGIASHELSKEELEKNDFNYQLIIAAKITKN